MNILHLAANRWWTGSADPIIQMVSGLRAHGHHALLAVYTSIGILVLTMCVIALTATIPAEWVGPLVYGVFLLSVLAVLGLIKQFCWFCE